MININKPCLKVSLRPETYLIGIKEVCILLKRVIWTEKAKEIREIKEIDFNKNPFENDRDHALEEMKASIIFNGTHELSELIYKGYY